MEIKYFRLIKTIAEEGSLANSADKLYLTQSALSHQLRELENQLGFKVFYRQRNLWKLTEEGKALHELSTNVLEQIDLGLKNIAQLRDGAAGSIKVSTECYSFYQGLAGFIQKMAVLYPEIKVELILEATHQPVSKLLSEDIDIAIVTHKSSEAQLNFTSVYDDEIFAIIHEEHPLAQQAFISVEQFTDLNLIIHSYPLETVSVYEHFLKPANVTPKSITAIPLTEVALELVQANMGVMCMPKWALKTFHLSAELIFVALGTAGMKRTHYLATRKADAGKKYIMDFILNFQENMID